MLFGTRSVGCQSRFKLPLKPRGPFLESPGNFSGPEAMFSKRYLKKREVYRRETLHRGNLCSYLKHHGIKQHCNHKV